MYDCTFCVDEMLTARSRGTADIPETRKAVTLIPFTQAIQAPQGTMLAVLPLPCCLEHRREQLAATTSRLLKA